MKKYFLIIFSMLVFSSVVSIADTSNLKNNFFSSIENLLDGNFKDTDFSIKSKEGNKPEIGILTFKLLYRKCY